MSERAEREVNEFDGDKPFELNRKFVNSFISSALISQPLSLLIVVFIEPRVVPSRFEED